MVGGMAIYDDGYVIITLPLITPDATIILDSENLRNCVRSNKGREGDKGQKQYGILILGKFEEII